jgi:hypothetical protein
VPPRIFEPHLYQSFPDGGQQRALGVPGPPCFGSLRVAGAGSSTAWVHVGLGVVPAVQGVSCEQRLVLGTWLLFKEMIIGMATVSLPRSLAWRTRPVEVER